MVGKEKAMRPVSRILPKRVTTHGCNVEKFRAFSVLGLQDDHHHGKTRKMVKRILDGQEGLLNCKRGRKFQHWPQFSTGCFEVRREQIQR